MAAHVYHWKHGWIPLDHEAALSKAKGNHKLAATYVAAVPHARGIQSRQDVAKAALDLPNIPNSADRMVAKADLQAAADRLGARDVLPSSMRSKTTITGMDQYGKPTTFTGHVAGRTPAHQGGVPGTVYSMHNGTDSSGLDATARGTVFVPDGRGQARSLTPEQLHEENRAGIQVGQEVALKTPSGLRIGTVESISADGRPTVAVPGYGKITRSGGDLYTQIPAATRAAEHRRVAGDWRKTPLRSLERAVQSDAYSDVQREAMRAEIARRLKAA